MNDQMTPNLEPSPATATGDSTWLKVLLAILVLVIVALLGWWLYKYQGTPTVETDSTDTNQTTPAVDESSGLSEAEQFLLATDIDSQLDTSELDAAFN